MYAEIKNEINKRVAFDAVHPIVFKESSRL
jgi:hypothetical protein